MLLPVPLPQLHTPIAVPISQANKQAWLDMRKSDVTGTEVSILFGKHHSVDLFTYWHIKHGFMDDGFEENKFTYWGRNNEDAIAQGICELEAWETRDGYRLIKAQDYYRHPTVSGAGATCDYFLESDAGNRIIVEIKNVSESAWQTSWVRDDVHTPPIYYELQLQQQLFVTGYSHGVIACLVGGNDHYIFVRSRNEPVIAQIEKKINKFWSMDKPNIFEHSTTETTMKALFKPDGTYADMSADGNAKYLFAVYLDRKFKSDTADEEKQHARLELIKLLGTHSRVRCGEYVISKAIDESIRITKQRQKLELKL